MKKLIIVFMCVGSSLFSSDLKVKEQTAIDKLKEIENKYYKYLSFDERREAIKLMDEIIDIINSEEKLTKPNKKETKLNKNNIILDSVFDELLENVSHEAFGDDQVRMILAIGEKGYLYSSQLKLLVDEIDRDQYKTELIKKIYSNIIDPVNLVIVTESYTFSSDRENIESWLQKQ